MSDIETLTIALPVEIALLVKDAVAEGNYTSTSEVISEALRDWKVKRDLHMQKFAALKADIDAGIADMATGRMTEFSVETIVERGRQILAERSSSV